MAPQNTARSAAAADRSDTEDLPQGVVLSALTVLVGALLLIAAAGAATGYALYGSADAEAVASFAEFSPCATIRQFGPGEAYWHHGHVYECASGTRNPPHVLTAPVAQ